MYAIFITGGKQYRAAVGDVILIEKKEGQAGETVVFDEVLLVNDGTTTKVGTPLLENAKVEGEIKDQVKGKKIIVFKMKAKKNYRKKQGHRQRYTKVLVTNIIA